MISINNWDNLIKYKISIRKWKEEQKNRLINLKRHNFKVIIKKFKQWETKKKMHLVKIMQVEMK